MCLPNVVSTLDSGKDFTDKETLSADTVHEEDPEQIAASHPRLVEALSEVPYSPLFGVLWPIITEQASFDTRDVLRKVSYYFQRLCKPYRDSDLAKRTYLADFGNREQREGLPLVLDLSFGAEWRCWGADKCGFNSVEAFRAFCALGDLDPDQGCCWTPDAEKYIRLDFPPRLSYIWVSRTKDVVIETPLDPLAKNGYCHFLGLTGVADKAIAMYNFMHDKYDDPDDSDDRDTPAMSTIWTTVEWGRQFI